MNEDSIQLLHKCNIGCKTATNSIEQILPNVTAPEFLDLLRIYDKKHAELGKRFHDCLTEIDEPEKDPSPVMRVMTWFGTQMRLMPHADDKKIAKLMMDGCNMGIESSASYLNEYKDAQKNIQELAQDLIQLEEDFQKALMTFL